jgi:hypothetical protein
MSPDIKDFKGLGVSVVTGFLLKSALGYRMASGLVLSMSCVSVLAPSLRLPSEDFFTAASIIKITSNRANSWIFVARTSIGAWLGLNLSKGAAS